MKNTFILLDKDNDYRPCYLLSSDRYTISEMQAFIDEVTQIDDYSDYELEQMFYEKGIDFDWSVRDHILYW